MMPISIEGGGIDLISDNNTIIANGSRGAGIWGLSSLGQGGDINITARNTDITTTVGGTPGIYALHSDADQAGGQSGDINIDLTNTSIMASADFGILAEHVADGDKNIFITLRNSDITTEGFSGHGIHTKFDRGMGSINIDLINSDITTAGSSAHGIYVLNDDDAQAALNINIDRSSTINVTETGPWTYGIRVQDTFSEGPPVDITVDGTINAKGPNGYGIIAGLVRSGAATVSAKDTGGYVDQTVRVNGTINSGPGRGIGIQMGGGGKVYIGPRGVINAPSGVAIRATGTTPGATLADDPVPPKLLVDIKPGGRLLSRVFPNNGWIINEGGDTTIVINDVLMHDGATGNVVGAIAHNGLYDITMAGIPRGWNVTDRPSTAMTPDDWTFEALAQGVATDRDFSAADFEEVQVRFPPPPPPPMCLAGQVGMPPNCREPETEMPMFIEQYAPRAALYEALPDFLLRMQNWDSASQRLAVADSSMWVQLLGSTGSQDFERSTVGVDYDSDRFAVKAGVTIPMSERLNLSASLHHVTGSAKVNSPTRGGSIHVNGQGLSLEALWSMQNDYYATGRLTFTNYDIDLSSSTIGRLHSDGDAKSYALHAESGRRMQLNDSMHWTPRVWLERFRISVDGFTDSVDSRVSFSDKNRTSAGIGVTIDTMYRLLALSGSLDLEQQIGSTKTVTRVSGEKLSAEPADRSIKVAIGSVWKSGVLEYSARLSARDDVGSGGEEYSGFINVGMGF